MEQGQFNYSDAENSAIKSPRIILTLIHGTFAREAPWTKEDSDFCRALKDRLGWIAPLQFNSFLWAGGNNLFDRHDAGEDLRKAIETTHESYPEVPHFLIAHSHGGNVASSLLSGAPVRGVTGIICLATPFFNLRLRSELLDSKRLGRAWTGLLALLAFGFGVIIGFPLWAQLLIMIVFILLGAVVGGYISGALENFREGCDRLVSLSTPARRIPMLIIRGTGDEASFLLGMGQMVDWLSQSLYRRAVRANTKPSLKFTLGRWGIILALWVGLTILAICFAGFVFLLGGSLNHAGRAAAIPLGAAMFFSFILKTNWFDNFAIGIATVLSMISNTLMRSWFGTTPPVDKGMGWFGRHAVSAGISILLEVRTEATPLGSWEVTQLGPTAELPDFIEGRLTHSVYDRPDAQKITSDWITHLSLRQLVEVERDRQHREAENDEFRGGGTL